MTAVTDTERSDEKQLRTQAIERLKKRQDFYAHLLVYTLINATLWTIWALTSADFPWPAFITAGWGVGLVMNAWEVYGRKPFTEAQVQHEMQRLREP